jgi:hypothetical protein
MFVNIIDFRKFCSFEREFHYTNSLLFIVSFIYQVIEINLKVWNNSLN